MSFNFGAFLGGAARGGSQVFDERRAQADRDKVTKEERQWQLATENRANARSKKAKRASDAKALEEQIGTMVALGMPADAARAVAKNGKGAMKVAISDLTYGRENGHDTSSLYALKDTVGLTSSEVTEAAKAPKLVVDSTAIRNMYGTVDNDVSNHNEAILKISDQQLNLNLTTPEGQAKYDILETKKSKYLQDIGTIASAKDTSKGDDSRFFGESTTYRHIISHRNRHLAVHEASVNIETGVAEGIKGKALAVNSADLKAVNSLRVGTKPLNDPFMNAEISALEQDAKINLQTYAAGQMGVEGFTYTAQYDTKQDVSAANKNRVPGDIVTYNKDGVTYQVMWVGVKGNEYISLGAVPAI